MSKRKKKKIVNIIGRIISIIGIASLSMFIYNLFKLDLLPIKYILILIGIILFMYIIMYIFILNKKIKLPIKIFSNIIVILFSTIFILSNKYIERTISFFDKINNDLFQTEEYYLITLKENDYNTIEDLNSKTVGFYNDNSTKNITKAVKKLGKKINFIEKDYDDIELLLDSLEKKQIDSILINESVKNIVDESYSYILNILNNITTIQVPIETSDIVKVVDVTTKPFNLLIIGSDSFGSIDKVSNADVNMLMTINSKTNEILLTSIPRDYYVELYDTKGEKDKLTHAGYYGIETSVKTIEKLLDTEINYYVKINFSTVIKIVDLIGGIDIYSDYDFCDSGKVGCYKKGYNHLNGKQALAFARERKSFHGGDRVRGQNQQKIIAAIINKMTTSTKIITKYNDILSSIEKSFQTNMDERSISKLVKLQLSKMPKWEITNQSLDGEDKYVTRVYSFSNPKGIYVMEPKEESVLNAKNKIKEIIEN